VRIAYSDESGAGDLATDPVAIVTAILANMDKYWPKIEAEMRGIAKEMPDTLLEIRKENGQVWREIKGKRLYQEIRKGNADAANFLFRILAITHDLSVPIYYGAIDRRGYEEYVAARGNANDPNKATALGAAFDACLARVALMVAVDLDDDEQILWIADHADKQKEVQTKGGLPWTRSLHHSGYDLITLEPKEIRREKPLRIADTIYFGHSHESLALQLADVCCSTVRLKLLEEYYGWRPAVAPFYAVIETQVMNNGERPKFFKQAKP
jgi:hypothetical protein